MEIIKAVIETGKKLNNRFIGHDVGARSAQMTYYWILAFFPFLILIITILSYTTIAEEQFIHYLEQAIPSTIMPLIKDTIAHLVQYRSASLVSFGAIASIWSASAAVDVMVRGMYRAYSGTDTRAFIVKKIVSIMYTFILLILIAGMIGLLVFGHKIGEYLLDTLFGNQWIYLPLWDLFRFSLSILVLVSGLYMIYRYIPRKHIKSANVWPGTIFATIGWYSFSILFSIYVDQFSAYNKMYGSIGGVFILLIWMYVNSMVLLMGAEINALWQDVQIMRRRKKNAYIRSH